ncbi:hypothetical protein GCM10023187_42210 [Nibrella viscosa]|uniref:Peptidase M15A C-terminal domain-containing protein n=1 Tax=Nibrella viscosa TaxID=1084524 RepID=A0ABP8KQQ8_9BACT
MPVPNQVLSLHFSLYEMLDSETATRFGFDEQFEPPMAVIENLRQLCVFVLEPLRMTLGVPIRINSGYRCERLNKEIKGSKTSQHMVGQAADIRLLHANMAESLKDSTDKLFFRIRATQLPYDQVIQEFDRWVHVSWSPSPRHEALLARRLGNGQVKYTPAGMMPVVI